MAFLSQVGGNKDRSNLKQQGGTPGDSIHAQFARVLGLDPVTGNGSSSFDPDFSKVANVDQLADQFSGLPEAMQKDLSTKANSGSSSAPNAISNFANVLAAASGATSTKKVDRPRGSVAKSDEDTSVSGTKPPPTNTEDINALATELAQAIEKGVSTNPRDPKDGVIQQLNAIAQNYQTGVINVGAIVDAWESLSALGLKDENSLKAAIVVGRLYDGKGTQPAGQFNSSVSLDLQNKKRDLTKLSQQLMNTQYQLIKVTQQIDENLSRASKIKKMLETAPTVDQAALNVALAQYVKAVNQYQPSWYLLDNLTRTLQHQMYNATVDAQLPVGQLAAFSDPPYKNNEEVLEGLMNRYGSELVRANAQGILAMSSLPTTYVNTSPEVMPVVPGVASTLL